MQQSVKSSIPDTMGDLPDTMGDLPDTMGDLPDTMGDLPDTTGDLPDTMNDLPDQPPAWSRISLGKRNTFSSSNPNYLFFETASISRSHMKKEKCNAANKNL